MSEQVYYNDNNPFCCEVLRKNIECGNLPKGYVDGRSITDVTASDLVGYQHIHLFAGIGGFPYGLRLAGVPTSIRLVTGGFPCQDISNAGKREGITGERSGLWKEMYRLIQESIALHMAPQYILVENVSALVNRGLSTVLGDLAACGYDAEWACLRASDVGAPHQRERVFLVAYPYRVRESWQNSNVTGRQRGTPLTTGIRQWEDTASMADAHSQRCEERDTPTGNAGVGQHTRCVSTHRVSGQSQPLMDRVLDGLSAGMDRYQFPSGPGERQQGWEPARVITAKEAHRVARLEALGNAIVPQLVVCIGKAIVESEVEACQ